jgi:3-hydroxyisobutyrate dehydrogenase-like beta-hydroxyacid dehydrogenase
MARIAFIGFGELAGALAEGMAAGGRHELRAYLRTAPALGSAAEARLQRARVRADRELREAVTGAEVVLAAVPGSACA